MTARVWFRSSTQEWMLEIEGTIEDVHMSCRHALPPNTKPEDVPGLLSLYTRLEEQEAEIRRLRGGERGLAETLSRLAGR